MSETTSKRQSSAVTLRCRAFVKAERLRAKMTAANAAEKSRIEKYRKRMDVLGKELTSAQREYEKHTESQ